jgi:hypothetical protein
MPCQVTWDFEEAGQGWAETYQISSDDPGSYIQLGPTGALLATCPAGLFLAARRNLLNNASSILHVRASKIRSAGVTLSAGIDALAGAGRYGTFAPAGEGGSTETFAKLLIRIQCTTVRRRTLWLGGIPEGIITAPQTYTPTDFWNTTLATFKGTLVGGGTTYGIAGRPARSSNPQAKQILTLVTDAGGYYATLGVLSTADYDAVNGGYAIIRGVRYPRGWNGIHLYQVIDATHLQIGPLRLPGHTVPTFRVGDRGTVQPNILAFSQYSNLIAERVTRRKIGLPFGVTRGRGPLR